MAQQTGIVRLLTVAIGAVSVIGTMMKLEDVPARIVYFRAINGTHSVAQGSHVLLQWRVQGLGSKAWLDGHPVNLEDTQDVLVTTAQTYKLVAHGLFGEDSLPVTIEVEPARQASDATPPTPDANAAIPAGDTPKDLSAEPASSGDAAQIESQGDLPGVTGGGAETAVPRGAGAVQPGFLSVRTNPPDSSLDILPLGHAKVGTVDVSCPPGDYTITARHDLFATDTRKVTVQAGQRLAVEIQLSPDVAMIHAELVDATTRAMGGDAVTGIRTATAVLAVDADNQQARSLLAQTYLRTGEIGSFYTAALQALQHHAPVPVDLLYRDKNFYNTVLLIGAKDFRLLSATVPNGPNFPHHPVLFGDIRSVEVIHDRAGEVYLQLKFADSAQRRQAEVRLFVNGIHLEKRQVQHAIFVVDQTVVVSPENASQLLDTVANVLTAAMSRQD